MINVIQVEQTPNPNAVKFHVDGNLLDKGTKQFESADEAANHILAKALFGIEGVSSIFISPKFFTINKSAKSDWTQIEPGIKLALKNLNPNLENSTAASFATDDADPDSLLFKINQVIDENVRPPLENDGGGLEIIGLDGYLLTIHYQGACGGCPSAAQGTMMAIQNLLQTMVDPQIQVISA